MNYYLSEYGNIWSVNYKEKAAYCNKNLITNNFKVSILPGIQKNALNIVDTFLWSDTTSKDIIAINTEMSSEKAEYLIDTLDMLRKTYGPIKILDNTNICISVRKGDVKIGTIDFTNGEIKLDNDISLEGFKIEAKETWESLKDIITKIDEGLDFEPDFTLDGTNEDLRSARALCAIEQLRDRLEEKYEKNNDLLNR